MLNVEETAKYIGFSRSFVYHHVAELGGIKRHSRVRFHPERLDDWLRAGDLHARRARHLNSRRGRLHFEAKRRAS